MYFDTFLIPLTTIATKNKKRKNRNRLKRAEIYVFTRRISKTFTFSRTKTNEKGNVFARPRFQPNVRRPEIFTWNVSRKIKQQNKLVR